MVGQQEVEAEAKHREYIIFCFRQPENVYIESVQVDYRGGLSLQLAQTLHWLDHAPLFCLFWTMCCFEFSEIHLPARLSREGMDILHRALELQE